MAVERLTPNTVLLVLLLNELNELSESDFNQNLNRFVIDRILVNNNQKYFCEMLLRTKLFGTLIMNSLLILTKKPRTLFSYDF